MEPKQKIATCCKLLPRSDIPQTYIGRHKKHFFAAGNITDDIG